MPCHDSITRQYFSYIGTVAADHSFVEFLKFVEWAVSESRLPGVQFLVATKSLFEVPDVLRYSDRVTIHQGKPLTDEEINNHYASTLVVWNAYARTTQSGVLAKSFMFGTPALVLRKNCNEFAHDGVEVKAIEHNNDNNDIASAVDEVRNNFVMYSDNCRRRFCESFYYRVYNTDFEAMTK